MNRQIKLWYALVAIALVFAICIIGAHPKEQKPKAVKMDVTATGPALPTAPVISFTPPVGSTIANCGIPAAGTPPPLCGITTGWYIWSASASSWVQIGPASVSTQEAKPPKKK